MFSFLYVRNTSYVSVSIKPSFAINTTLRNGCGNTRNLSPSFETRAPGTPAAPDASADLCGSRILELDLEHCVSDPAGRGCAAGALRLTHTDGT